MRHCGGQIVSLGQNGRSLFAGKISGIDHVPSIDDWLEARWHDNGNCQCI